MIPNVHPIFVHFTVALFSISFILYLLTYYARYQNIISMKMINEIEVTARWCLWLSAFITIFTAIAGFYAFNTVSHDAPSHIAMTNHRNWAIPTAFTIILLSIWSAFDYLKLKRISFLFIIGMFVGQGLLLSTAWRGGELVFRYGLGVMSLPKSEGTEHHHEDKNNNAAPHSHDEH